MKCKNIKCNKEHSGQYGSGKYCSRACANSRSFSEETLLLKSNSARTSKKVKLANKFKTQKSIDKRKQTFNNKILNSPWECLSFYEKRKRVLLEQCNKCNKCSLNRWLNNKLILELEHIDGNTNNNSRENLEGLCPNCHSQTKTWRRGGKLKLDRISDDLLLKTIKNYPSIRKALESLNLRPDGYNYYRARLLKTKLTMTS